MLREVLRHVLEPLACPRALMLCAAVAAAAMACRSAAGAPGRPGQPDRPQRVVLIVIDQCRSDYVSRYPMPRLQRLMGDGAWFTQAYVGHLAAETIVSHPVMATGLLPRHLPWSDEVLRDDRGLLGMRGLYYVTAFFERETMERLFAPLAPDLGGPESLPRLIRRALGGTVYAIGQKDYAANSLGADGADGVVTLSEPLKDGPWAGWRSPAGRGLPPGLAGPPGGLLYVDSRGTHGTASLEYPHKGDMYHPSADPRRLGGDAWVARAALEVMRRDPSWRGLLLTLGSVDRVGHMHGVPAPGSPTWGSEATDFAVPDALAAADAAVGQVLDALERRGLLEHTLLVICSDHGAQSGSFVGQRGPGRAYTNWYFGAAANADFRKPSAAIRPLAERPEVGYVMADSAIRVWLANPSLRAQVAVGRVLRDMPGVVWVHGLIDGVYKPLFQSEMAGTHPWEDAHAGELLATLAGPHAPELIARLSEGINYGAPGDHGGTQEQVQRIPLILSGPGVARGLVSAQPARLVDIVPTVRALLGEPPDPRLDGRALEVTGR